MSFPGAGAGAGGPPPSRLSTKVQLRIRAGGLPRLDVMSKSDPFCAVLAKGASLVGPDGAPLTVSQRHAPGGAPPAWREVGRTETVHNTDRPSFSTTVVVDYVFEEVQPLKLVLWDDDGPGSAPDYIGEFETTLGHLMGSRGASQTGRLVHIQSGKERGSVCVTGAEIVGSDRDFLRAVFAGRKLDKKDFFGKSDPYITISRPTAAEYNAWRGKAVRDATAPLAAVAAPSSSSSMSASSSVSSASSPTAAAAALAGLPVAGSGVSAGITYGAERQRLWTGPVVMNTLDPDWPPVEIPLHAICGGDKDGAPVVLEVWDYDKHSTHDVIGELPPMTVGELVAAVNSSLARGGMGPPQWPVIHTKKKEKKGSSYNNSGILTCLSASFYRIHSFLEYLTGGLSLSLTVAVDFTGSNGNPSSPSSLHFLDPRPGAPLNPYAAAIASVGAVVGPYDTDGGFAAFGFGGSVDGGRTTSHCFPLSLNPAAIEVPGVQGLLSAYANALRFVGLSGPTLFSPIIRQAMAQARSGGPASQHMQRYSVLLLLTDGQCNDADDTVDAIVEAANTHVPLSIIIIGVGNADFSAMEMLDGDGDGRLKNRAGHRASRDLVQFVPFNKYSSLNDGGVALAAEVLAELPDQVTSFFTSLGIVPNAPVRAPSPIFGAAMPAPAAAAGPPPMAIGPGAGAGVMGMGGGVGGGYPPQPMGMGYPPQQPQYMAGGYPPQPPQQQQMGGPGQWTGTY
jgi:hypothetical protein